MAMKDSTRRVYKYCDRADEYLLKLWKKTHRGRFDAESSFDPNIVAIDIVDCINKTNKVLSLADCIAETQAAKMRVAVTRQRLECYADQARLAFRGSDHVF